MIKWIARKGGKYGRGEWIGTVNEVLADFFVITKKPPVSVRPFELWYSNGPTGFFGQVVGHYKTLTEAKNKAKTVEKT